VNRYLLDTDIVIEILRGRRRSVVERLAATRRDHVALSAISVAELFFGAHRSRNFARNMALCREFCDSFHVLPLTSAAAERSAAVRAELESSGARIGAYDVLIAGIALAEDRILATHNMREFGRIPNLQTEDWIGSSPD
jgi:tRNA(fMet)-specific endonuclease VapC